jgi:hypothetical protein
MNSPLIEYFNQKLAERGRSLDGRPIWRISWSTSQREKRLGKFSDFYGSIFLREVQEVREVPKYWHNPDRWVLERLCFLPPNAAIHREIVAQLDLDITKPTVNGSYEPIYFFQDKQGRELPVTEWALEAVMYSLEFGVKGRVSDSTMREEYIAETDKEAAYFEAELAEMGRSPLFAFENSVFLDSQKSVYVEKVGPDAIVGSKK